MSKFTPLRGKTTFTEGQRPRRFSLSGGPGLMHTVGVVVIYTFQAFLNYISTVASCRTEGFLIKARSS